MNNRMKTYYSKQLQVKVKLRDIKSAVNKQCGFLKTVGIEDGDERNLCVLFSQLEKAFDKFSASWNNIRNYEDETTKRYSRLVARETST